MENRRYERVRELLKRQLSEILLRELPVSEAGLVTVNEVVLAGDLRTATVYLGMFGPPEQQRHCMNFLTRHRGRIQSMLAGSVILKYTPTLRFVVDNSVERGNRVLQIIEEIEKSQPQEPT
ncbi:MAG TPA: 30S ribosome-binding factor RbfA [Verrucomicrobiota bacterium]|nr:30S ribosome-binding factor RbfA [Verrucomicrobiota bacterium]HOK76550.1 30S ribosome-binding factor RbfA [Verrucomicrobiota bacterium]